MRAYKTRFLPVAAKRQIVSAFRVFKTPSRSAAPRRTPPRTLVRTHAADYNSKK